jgi:hypothetical protein
MDTHRGLGRAKVLPIERLVDCLIMLLLMPVLLPVGLLIAAVVFLDSPGSVFYRATRIGLNGQPFEMLKFRTMKSGCKGPGISTSFDERFTPVGRFLARYRLDEFPQFWNVIKGETRVPRDPPGRSGHHGPDPARPLPRRPGHPQPAGALRDDPARQALARRQVRPHAELRGRSRDPGADAADPVPADRR